MTQGPELGHGLFTHYLVQGLRGAADLDRDGIVSLQELYQYLEQQVSQKQRQIAKAEHRQRQRSQAEQLFLKITGLSLKMEQYRLGERFVDNVVRERDIAFVNRACVFGAIARLGSGEWAYVVTPVGFYVGCLSFGYVFGAPSQAKLPYGSPVLQASSWVALLFLGLMLWRLGRPLFAAQTDPAAPSLLLRLRHALTMRIWSPHAATTVIGIAFFFMLLLVGAWAYTDVLAEAARGMANNLSARGLLLLALFLGALLGGWTAGRFRSARVSIAQLLKCFLGGLLMGWGSLLIPGGNDAVAVSLCLGSFSNDVRVDRRGIAGTTKLGWIGREAERLTRRALRSFETRRFIRSFHLARGLASAKNRRASTCRGSAVLKRFGARLTK